MSDARKSCAHQTCQLPIHPGQPFFLEDNILVDVVVLGIVEVCELDFIFGGVD